MTNEFAEAIKPKPGPQTHTVDHPHFYQAQHDQYALERKARNMTRQEMFNNGMITVDDMDDEELRYGRCRDANGKIPRVTKTLENIPRDLYDEMVAEHAKRFDEKLRQHLDIALDTMVDVMTDPLAEPKDKADAAKWFVERVRGKTADKVIISPDKEPWQELLGDVAHLTYEQHQKLKQGVIDVEVVESPDSDAPLAGSNALPQQDGSPGYHDAQASDGSPPNGHSVGEPRPGQDVDARSAQVPGRDDIPRLQGLVDERGGVDTPRAKRERDASLGVGEFDWAAVVPSPFDPAPPAPNHEQPAMSNPVAAVALSEQLRIAKAAADEIAAARKARKKLIEDAKRMRLVGRMIGSDVLQANLVPGAFKAAQDRLLDEVDTQTQDERDTDPPR